MLIARMLATIPGMPNNTSPIPAAIWTRTMAAADAVTKKTHNPIEPKAKANCRGGTVVAPPQKRPFRGVDPVAEHHNAYVKSPRPPMAIAEVNTTTMPTTIAAPVPMATFQSGSAGGSRMPREPPGGRHTTHIEATADNPNASWPTNR